MSDNNGQEPVVATRPTFEDRKARAEQYAAWRREFLAKKVADCEAKKKDVNQTPTRLDLSWRLDEYRTGLDPLSPEGLAAMRRVR